MSDIAIHIENISKQYFIGGKQEQYKTFQETLIQTVKSPFQRAFSLFRGHSYGAAALHQAIWALKDVSFEVKYGEVIGVIGRNGAGKSTLLKILSRITSPTEGRVRIRGRVGSLLEVGTGFHPELTGRENVFLNGSILGMKRNEINQKFDEIVDFSGIEKFIDTPVKHYSSGMQVRLAFAVAAHLEPEILIVDEVLAVGDAAFQKKCMGKMGDVTREGRTVLFVSHNMSAVQSLCSKSIWLSNGKKVVEGKTKDVIEQYLWQGELESQWFAHTQQKPQVSNPYFNPLKMAVVNQNLEVITRSLGANEKFGVLIEGETQEFDIALTIGFALYATEGQLLLWSLHTDKKEEEWIKMRKGSNRLVAWFPEHFLNEGNYRVELILSLHFKQWISQPGVNAPSVQFSIHGGLSESPYWMAARPGLLAPILTFEELTEKYEEKLV